MNAAVPTCGMLCSQNESLALAIPLPNGEEHDVPLGVLLGVLLETLLERLLVGEEAEHAAVMMLVTVI